MSHFINTALFGIYPYICLTVLLVGSVVRFDYAPYTWKSDSSQLLRRRRLRLGSNLFHYGILVVIIGHFVGFLMPDWAVSWLISPAQHELLAMVVGGVAGVFAIVGLTMLIVRRLSDVRIRRNSRAWDIAIVLILWCQLLLGLLTVPVSAMHMNGILFEHLVAYVKGILLFQPDVTQHLIGTPLIYRVHIFVGFTIILVSPFTRMIHIWSAPIWYLLRHGYQIVRTRKTAKAKAGEARP